jgi:hypothetical protein
MSKFVIDEDDDEGIADTIGVTVSKTDAERAQALALHRMCGLKKGDTVNISRAELPGAILFPCIKFKMVPSDVPAVTLFPSDSPQGKSRGQSVGGLGDTKGADGGEGDGVDTVAKAVEKLSVVDGGTSSPGFASPVKGVQGYPEVEMTELQVHRYLVISRERFIVLDSKGEGVGSAATVKSNHHLTELIKMTFKKKDPELVTLFFASNPGAVLTVVQSPTSPPNPNMKARRYRVSKRTEFVEALQKNMQRFK